MRDGRDNFTEDRISDVSRMIIQATLAFGNVTFCVLTEPRLLHELSSGACLQLKTAALKR